MKRQRISDASLLSAGACLGQICGTNIDTEGVEFTNQQPNLMYIDKVFSFQEETSSPILFYLNTGGAFTDYYLSELTLDGCSIFPCTLSPNAVFKIDNSFVVVDFFSTNPPGSINASQVTLDGFPVDSVSFDNGQYTARTQNVLARVQNQKCLDRGLPTKAFFMINSAGPWTLRATYVLEGTVNTGGRTCRFCAKISNAPDASNTELPEGSRSSFAVRNLSLPCSINGISPDVLFQFSAKVNLINPELVVDCSIPLANIVGTAGNRTASKLTGIDLPIPPIPCPPIPDPCPPIPCPPIPDPCPPCPDCPPCPPCPQCPPCPPCPPVIVSPISADNCRVSLVATVAVEPVVHVETVRRTLFCVNGCEALQPCQGSVAAAAIADRLEDCAVGGVTRPDCSCSSVGGASCTAAGGASVCGIDSVAGISGCGIDSIAGIGSCGIGSVAGIGDCARKGVLGASDRAHLEKLLLEILEKLSEESCSTAGIGFAPDGTFGCGEEIFGINTNEDFRNKARTASRLRSSNGCSW